MPVKIDFYHVDAMEAAHFEPLWRALRKAGAEARLVAVPGRRNAAAPGWFDFSRLKAYYEERGIPFSTKPDHAAHAITTQNCELLLPYRGLHIRLMYGPVVYPDAWGLSERAIRPFDAILVHGPIYGRLFSRWQSCDDLLTIGYPCFDDYFAGRLDLATFRQRQRLEAGRRTLVYLPTWGDHSSLDRYLEAISDMAGRCNLLVKPHHCTVRFEPQRMDRLRQAEVRLVESVYDLPSLYAVADVVLADVRSAAFCEALALGRPAIGLLTEPADRDGWVAAAGISALAEVCTLPAELDRTVEAVLASDPFASARECWAADHLACRDGLAAERAAAELLDYLGRKTAGTGSRKPRGLLVGAWSKVRGLGRRSISGRVKWRSKPDTFVPYRTSYLNERNRQLVEASGRGDYDYLVRHLVAQDSRCLEDCFDENIEVRAGLKLIRDEIVRSGRERTVVDIACGNCSLLKDLARQGYRVIGIDASPIRVLKNRTAGVKDLFFGVAEELPLADASADVVVATEALEHVFDAEKAVAEIARVLRPGGVVYCQVPEFDFADGENHLRHFSPESLQRLFAGRFEMESVRLIPYLDGERPRNIFLVARKPAQPEGREP